MKRTSLILIVFFIVFGIVEFSYSQEKLVLDLNKSIHLALSQNPLHLISEEKVTAAQYNLKQATSRFFPTLNVQGMSNILEKVFELEFPSLDPGQPPKKVKFDFTRDYQFSMSLALPLYLGGAIRSGLRLAKHNISSAQEGVSKSTEEMVFNVKGAFYGYLLGKEFAEVAEEAVKLAEKHLNNVRSLYKAGLASKFDLLRSEVQLANLKPQLIKARNSLKLTELNLKSLLGIKLTQLIEVQGELVYKPFEPNEESCLEKALLSRPEINQLLYQKRMAGETLKIANASRLPSLAISGNYNFWADALNLKKDTWQSFYTVNLVLTVPVFNGFISSVQIGQAKTMIKEIELTHRGLVDRVKLEVKQTILSLNEAKESIFSQEKNVEQAQESVRIAELNFSEGLATTLDVNSAQMALSQAKSNYAQALFDYVLSLAQLEKAMGTGWSK